MALIKTDNQNYTNIANAIREIVGCKTFFDANITTVNDSSGYYVRNGLVSEYKFEDIVSNYQQRIGEIFEIVCDDISYFCELKIFENSFYYLGNLFVVYNDDDFYNTGEPFCISVFSASDYENLIGKIGFFTAEAKTYHFAIVKNHYKPEEMKPILDEYIPDYGVSYDTFDENGNVLSATTYGYKVAGLTGNKYLQTVNIDSNATEIGDYAFSDCASSIIVGDGLTSLELPIGITKIGNNAFTSCYLLKSLELPDTITEIGDLAFYYCDNLVLNKLPLNLKKIGHAAFGAMGAVNNSTVSELIIPENVKEIGYLAFISSCYTKYTFKGKPDSIGNIISRDIFDENVEVINVPWSEGEVLGAPWGATNATINYNYTESTEV